MSSMCPAASRRTAAGTSPPTASVGPADLVELFGAEARSPGGTVGPKVDGPLLGRGPAFADGQLAPRPAGAGRPSGRSDGLVMAQARWSARSTRSRASAANGPVRLEHHRRAGQRRLADDGVPLQRTARARASRGGWRAASASATACRRRRRSGPAATTSRSSPVPGPDSHSTPAGSSGSNASVPAEPPQHGGRRRSLETEAHGASAGGVSSAARRRPPPGPTARRARSAGLEQLAQGPRGQAALGDVVVQVADQALPAGVDLDGGTARPAPRPPPGRGAPIGPDARRCCRPRALRRRPVGPGPPCRP